MRQGTASNFVTIEGWRTHSAQDELTRAILDAVHQPLLVIDPDGAVAQANNAASHVLGHKDHRGLIGRSTHEALHAFHADGFLYPADQCPIVHSSPSPHAPSGHEVFLDRVDHPVHVSRTVSALPRPSYRLLAFIPDTAARAASSPQEGRPSSTSLREQIERDFRDPSLAPLRLAQRNHLSLRTLQAILAREELAPAAMIRSERLDHARQLLAQGSLSRTAGFDSGFDDADTFTRAFRRRYGVTPSAYRAENGSV